MILNAQQILDKGLLIPSEFCKPAQVGIDLTLKSLTVINGNSYIGIQENNIPKYRDTFRYPTKEGGHYYKLESGVYSLTFNEGCKLDTNHCAFIQHRSSMQRSGVIISSGVFDPGFECSEIGATMFVHLPIIIEVNARIAQFVVHENYEAEAYNGQYQGEKDRK